MFYKSEYKLIGWLACVFIFLSQACIAGACSGLQVSQDAGEADIKTLQDEVFVIEAQMVAGVVNITIVDRRSGLLVAEGPYICSARSAAGEEWGLEEPDITVADGQLTLRGRLGPMRLTHHFELLAGRAVLEEWVELQNEGGEEIELAAIEIGLSRSVTINGVPDPSLERCRVAAVPFRRTAADSGEINEWSMLELLSEEGRVHAPGPHQQRTPALGRHRASEGWAWLHSGGALVISKFSREHMEFSVLSRNPDVEGALRLGGLCMVLDSPAVLKRFEPGQEARFGRTRYESVAGSYTQAAYAFRAMLDEYGCRFPADYNPPVHWNQLYDMSGAWTNRPHLYTLAALHQQADTARTFSCEALYLDPGWDTDFGTFIWGADWLGPFDTFVTNIEKDYGLSVSLHCPLSTWISHEWSWGRGAVGQFPDSARRQMDAPPHMIVPGTQDGRRNLALLPGVTADASSSLAHPRHNLEHIHDGNFGNAASWIAAEQQAWVELDMGKAYPIDRVVVSNDGLGIHMDRAAVAYRVQVAGTDLTTGDRGAWVTVGTVDGEKLLAERTFEFSETLARWVRVEVLGSHNTPPRIDEVQVYETPRLGEAELAVYEAGLVRRAAPPVLSEATLCLGSKAYRDVAVQRLLELCEAGAGFLMFDGNWWPGTCTNPDHGHPVPYRYEDHIEANMDMARRIKEQYPDVLIEMHDMLSGGSYFRATPVYGRYGLENSYDENWGFELMWNPIQTLREGRARSLYYYALACNIPLYLHVDLKTDNEHGIVLWWNASTVRHLGIGGTHANPAVREAQKNAMKRYRELGAFYKRGEFYGINEEIHLHVLPEQNAVVVNVFNLTDAPRTVTGTITLTELGLPAGLELVSDGGAVQVRGDRLHVVADLPAWGTEVVLCEPR